MSMNIIDNTIMKYTIYNPSSGETFPMTFKNKQQLKDWLAETGWINLGELKTYLPTRHERMKNKDEEFAGWGS
jgi:hypothetical protein